MRTILNPDSILFEKSQLKEIAIESVIGAKAIDTFPIGAPDGWIPKVDSPYYNSDVADLGQISLYDDMFSGEIERYPGYVDGDWREKDWDQLSRYRQMLQHMTNEESTQEIGWSVRILFFTEIDPVEQSTWEDMFDSNGYDDVETVTFDGEMFEVNTHFFSTPGMLLSPTSTPHNAEVSLFIPKSKADIYNKLLADIELWKNEPFLVEQQESGKVRFVRV